MGQSRLNHLTLPKHKELLDNYGLVSVAFAQANDHRVEGYNDFLLTMHRMIITIWLIFNQKGSQSTGIYIIPGSPDKCRLFHFVSFGEI